MLPTICIFGMYLNFINLPFLSKYFSVHTYDDLVERVTQEVNGNYTKKVKHILVLNILF